MSLGLYTLGILVSETPWFFLTTVPFWGNERVKKKWIAVALIAFPLLQTAVGYYIFTYAPDKNMLLDYGYVLQPLFLLAVYSVCYKVHMIKLLYATLLTMSISMPVNTLAVLIATPFMTFTPGKDIIPEATPVWILTITGLIAAAVPLIYRLFRRVLRDALSGFTAKTTMYLCATSLLFYIFYAYSVLAVPYFNMVYLFITPVAGVFCTYINLRMILYLQELAQNKSDMRLQEIKNEYLLENYQTLENHYQQIVETKHEMRHHLFAIRTLLDNREYEKLETYLSKIQEHFSEAPEPIPCENRVIQAILGHASRRAKELGFNIEYEMLPLPDLTIPEVDLVSLLMNLMENALESNANIQEHKDRWIQVKLKTRPPYLCLSICNARCGELMVAGNSYATTKNTSVLHGHGIAVVKRIVDKYHGLISFEHTDNTFHVEIALPVI